MFVGKKSNPETRGATCAGDVVPTKGELYIFCNLIILRNTMEERGKATEEEQRGSIGLFVFSKTSFN